MSPDLTPPRQRRARRAGPAAVAAPAPPAELLEQAGFVDVEETDLTAEFAAVETAWIDEWDAHRDALVELLGATDFDERQRRNRTQHRAIDDGLLRRTLVVGTRPGT